MSGEPRPTVASEASTWTAKAEEDRRAARHRLTMVPPLLDVVGLHVQKPVEKRRKALLILAQCDVPKIHDIETLLRLLPPAMDLPPDLADAVRHLTPWAVAGRDPAPPRYRGPTEVEVIDALAAADRLASFVEARAAEAEAADQPGTD